jgi:hypothetical protein
MKFLKIDKMPISRFLVEGNEGFNSSWPSKMAFVDVDGGK